MKQFDIERVYEAYTKLDKAQRKELIARLNAEGIPVLRIEAYTYKDAPGIKHLFFYLEDSNKIIPYYLLPLKYLKLIENEIFKYNYIL